MIGGIAFTRSRPIGHADRSFTLFMALWDEHTQLVVTKVSEPTDTCSRLFGERPLRSNRPSHRSTKSLRDRGAWSRRSRPRLTPVADCNARVLGAPKKHRHRRCQDIYSGA